MIDAILASIKNFKLQKSENHGQPPHPFVWIIDSKDKIPNKDILLSALAEANESIKITSIPSNYLKREGALVLKNLYDYQEQLQQESY
jgi:hypothetical protein